MHHWALDLLNSLLLPSTCTVCCVCLLFAIIIVNKRFKRLHLPSLNVGACVCVCVCVGGCVRVDWSSCSFVYYSRMRRYYKYKKLPETIQQT